LRCRQAGVGKADIQVTDPTTGTTAKVELGIDWRAHPAVTLPVARFCIPTTPLATRSAPSAAEPRHATSSMSTPSFAPADTTATNCTRAKEHDSGFDEDTFVLALRAIRRLPVAEFIPYKVENTETHALIERTARWADELRRS
jgi:hypothetical protein